MGMDVWVGLKLFDPQHLDVKDADLTGLLEVKSGHYCKKYHAFSQKMVILGVQGRKELRVKHSILPDEG